MGTVDDFLEISLDEIVRAVGVKGAIVVEIVRETRWVVMRAAFARERTRARVEA